MQAYTQERPLTKDNVKTVPKGAMPIEGAMEKGDTKTVETRFGKVTLQLAKALHFPKGILGMPEKKQFCINDFPMERFKQFKLLQSVEDDDLAFITFPVGAVNEFIQRDDITEACQTLSINESDLAVLLIVTVHRRVNSISLSANIRAPLLIDTANKVATQYVLPNNKYDIRHPLSDIVVETAGK